MALRVIAALGVLAVTLLAVLLVFGFIGMSEFWSLLGKVALLAVIVAGASLLLGLLASRAR